jgi:hypothetical protein
VGRHRSDSDSEAKRKVGEMFSKVSSRVLQPCRICGSGLGGEGVSVMRRMPSGFRQMLKWEGTVTSSPKPTAGAEQYYGPPKNDGIL